MNNMVSVIIPTYNRAYCLKRSIESVLHQTYTNLELLIIDDCSNDNTEEVVRQIDDARIRYIRLNENLGPSKARNIGIENARGQFIAFQDSDDIWYNNKLKQQMNKFLTDKNCHLVFCQFLSKGEDEFLVPAENYFDVAKYKYGMFEILLKGNRIGTPTIVVKKDIIDKIGGFNENIKTLEDWEFVLRVAEKYNIIYINKALMDVYPSKGGVNRVTGYHKAAVSIVILKEFWNKYKDKRIFEWILKDFLNDLNAEHNKEKKQLLLENISQVIGYKVFNELLLSFAGEHSAIDDCLKIEIEKKNKLLYIEKYKKRLFVKIINYLSKGLLYKKINNFSNHIAIYGAGEVSQTLVPLLLDLGLHIQFLIDRTPKIINNIPCYNLDKIPDRDIGIIITAFDPQRNIISNIYTNYHIPVIYLEDLLE